MKTHVLLASLVVLSAWPATVEARPDVPRSAPAHLRAFALPGAPTYTLKMDGRVRIRSAGRIRSGVGRIDINPGNHLFVVMVNRRVAARAIVAVEPGERLTALFGKGPGRRSIFRIVSEGPTIEGRVAARLANLDRSAGAVTVRIGDGFAWDGVQFGTTSLTMDVDPDLNPSGSVLVTAAAGAADLATSSLPLASDTRTTFVLVASGGGHRLVRLPWDQALPEPVVAPKISGIGRVTNTLTCHPGKWRGHPTLSYVWTIDGSPERDATRHTLTLTTVDHAGHVIGCVITARATGGVVKASAQGAINLPPAPVAVAPPSLDGTPTDGGTLTCNRGVWAGALPSFSYAWFRAGAIADGEVGDTLTLHVTADEGKPIHCSVTATTDGGEVTLDSPTKTLGAPTVFRIPSLSRSYAVDQVLTISPGEWHDADGAVVDPTRAYQWWTCTPGVGQGPATLETLIAGATGTTFTLDLLHLHVHLCARELIALNGYTSYADSRPSAEILPKPPAVTASAATAVDPTSAVLNGTIDPHGDPATWLFEYGEVAAAVFTAATPDGGPVIGTSATSVSASLVGLTPSTAYRFRLDGLNPGGSTASTEQRFYTAPANDPADPPSLAAFDAATLAVGSTVTCQPGTWSAGGSNGVPVTDVSYSWFRTFPGGAPVPIDGAAGATYTLRPADGGPARESCSVTGSNAGSSGGATAVAATGEVALPVPPQVVVTATPPSPYADAIHDASVTLHATVDAGNDDTTVAFEWGTSLAYGSSTPTSAAPSGTSSQVGRTITVPTGSTTYHYRAVATNRGGTVYGPDATFTSAPQNLTPPQILPPSPYTVGTVPVGETVFCSAGTWTARDTVTFEWVYDGMTPAGTGQTHDLTVADASHTLACRQIASNLASAGGGATSAVSPNPINLPLPPTSASPPTIVPDPSDATLRTGKTITASDGMWSEGSPVTTTYDWLRCDPTGVSCTTVIGSGTGYTVQDADLDRPLQLRSTHVNRTGTGIGVSSTSAPVADSLPAVSGTPTITGSATAGATLTANTSGVAFTGSRLVPVSYSWQSCAGATCTTVGAAATYTIADSDVGGTVVVTVARGNAAGTASASSIATSAVIDSVPGSTGAPTITGTATVPQVLTASDATVSWSGSNLTPVSYQWQTCASGTCSNLAAGTTYTLQPTDAGQTIRVVATRTNTRGPARSTTSLETVAIANSAPGVTSGVPTIAATTLTVGQALTGSAADVVWSGSNLGSINFQWQRCTPGCSNISGATSSTYTLALADASATIRLLASRTNTIATATATSGQTSSIADTTPTATGTPTINGTPTVGQTLTASDTVSWGGSNLTAATYQWQTCAAPGSCSNLATGASYTLTSLDAGQTIRLVASRSNNAGTATATSSETTAILDTVPTATGGLPAITGILTVDETLAGTDLLVTWSGSNLGPTAYQWQTCSGTATNTCSSVSGATASTYTLLPSDAGKHVRLVASRTNSRATATTASAVTSALVANTVPGATGQPTISGSVVVGQTITASDAAVTWSGSNLAATTWQWQICTAPGICGGIPGATASTYTVQIVDAQSNKTIRLVARRSNSAGLATATSDEGFVFDSAPAVTNDGVPSIAGTRTVGQTLTASSGGITWGGSNLTPVAYQWQTCSTPTVCTDLTGATANTYVLQTTDASQTIRVVASRSNNAGTATATSAETTVILDTTPTAGNTPTISGTPTVGQTLTATDTVTWGGSNLTATAYQWQRCTPVCVAIGGATGASYTLQPADAGRTIRVAASRSNNAGTATATSSATASIADTPATASGAPTITGASTVVGQTLTASDTVTWGGSNLTATAYRWQDCTAPGTCADLPGETGTTYLIGAGEVGRTIRVIASRDNNAGTATSDPSAETTAVANSSAGASGAPTITGTETVGQTLTASSSPVIWAGSNLTAVAFQWQTCSAPTVCTDLTGATATTYVLKATDATQTIRVLARRSNTTGITTATSAETTAIANSTPTVASGVPTITGSPTVDQTLTASSSLISWGGSNLTAVAFQWQTCSAPTVCTDLTGATATTYVLKPADTNQTIRVVARRSNNAGTATATSDETTAVVDSAPGATGTVVLTPGAPVVTDVVTADMTGVLWSGSNLLAEHYAWEHCMPDLTGCISVGTDAATYTVDPLDAGFVLRVTVTRTNGAGTATITSPETAPIP